MKNIRNFCIIAHIDHGKSTLADRLLDFTQTVTEREKQDQLLDNMDLERERGITIKSHAIQMEYVYKGEKYILNLIDTPGHVDFSYEVSRSIAACEGALLIVDAAQSIQAQTISNLYWHWKWPWDHSYSQQNRPAECQPRRGKGRHSRPIGLLTWWYYPCQWKDRFGSRGYFGGYYWAVFQLRRVILRAPLQALIFDSVYNSFRGVETYFRVMNGEIRKGQKIKFMSNGKTYDADEVGTLKLNQVPKPVISTGDVGYLITGIKDAREVKVGEYHYLGSGWL